MNYSEYQWEQMVLKFAKSGKDIQESLSFEKIDLIHAVMGISGEAGELLDAIKKHIVYNNELDVENVIEEVGDILFYLQMLVNNTTILSTLNHAKSKNFEKLNKRYNKGKYEDKAAQERADKQPVTFKDLISAFNILREKEVRSEDDLAIMNTVIKSLNTGFKEELKNYKTVTTFSPTGDAKYKMIKITNGI